MRTRKLYFALLLGFITLCGGTPVVGAAGTGDMLAPARPPLTATDLVWRLPNRVPTQRPLIYDRFTLRHLGIPLPASGAPAGDGRVILVSVSQQWLWAYDDHRLVYASEVTTGMPHLDTPLGTYTVQLKAYDTWFTSPWPYGSPYYYAPLVVRYALLFRAGGFYIHDAPWRQSFGPGSNVPHLTLDGAPETGSHGCVDVPSVTGAWLFSWASVGTTVSIVA
jgi:lipoprotein-anchoring transpeptidase ErfK/SrfK